MMVVAIIIDNCRCKMIFLLKCKVNVTRQFEIILFGLFESTNIAGTLENKRLLEYFISPEKRR